MTDKHMEEVEQHERQTKHILTTLKDLIETGRRTFYVPQYQAKISEEDILGVIVAKFVEWEGARIVKVFLSAFEDANYHELREEIEQLWEGKTASL